MLMTLQVLAKALEVFNLNLEPLDAPNMRPSAQHPEQEDAFICNLQVSLQTTAVTPAQFAGTVAHSNT